MTNTKALDLAVRQFIQPFKRGVWYTAIRQAGECALSVHRIRTEYRRIMAESGNAH